MAVGSGYAMMAVIALADGRPGHGHGDVAVRPPLLRGAGSLVLLLVRCGIARRGPRTSCWPPAFAAHADFADDHRPSETASKGSALEAKFAVRLRDPAGLVAFLTEVRKIDGVQDAELKQAN